MDQIVQHVIGGQRINGGGRFGDVFNPATGELTGKVAMAGARRGRCCRTGGRSSVAGLGRDAAADARAGHVPLPARCWSANAERIAAQISPSTARSSPMRGRTDARRRSGRIRRRHSAVAQGRVFRECRPGMDSYSLRQPLGVVAGITPFNFPAMVPLWMFPVAIACGNCFVLKPSERDPSTALLLAELLNESGLPAACSTSCKATARRRRAARPPDMRAISFVGSTPVARYIYRGRPASAASVRRRWAARRTTWLSCRTPIWTRPRMP